MRNSMLNTELGRARYYEYQKKYRSEHTSSYTVRFNNKEHANVIEALKALPSKGVARNTFIRDAIMEKLARDGFIQEE